MSRSAATILPVLLSMATAAGAGAPYVTDDPAPPEPGEWEIESFVEGAHSREGTEGAAGFDISYGMARDLQVTTALGVEFERGAENDSGVADIEVGAKYRFLHQREGSWIPDIAFYPSIGLPTGARRFSEGRVSAFLPLWAQKDKGEWSAFGGGGYAVNPGDGNRDYWLFGVAITRQVNDRLKFGAEIYHQTPEVSDGESVTGMGLGLTYALNDRWAFLASAGPVLNHHRLRTGDYTFYAALGFAR
jgi:hypothetical protein